MPFDAHANLAYSTLVSAPTPALSGTALSVASGQGALFPAVPFNATVWPPSVMPITTNAEIVRVTNITADVLTIARAQESTTAMPLAVGYQIANTITKKVITDIESAVSGGGITALTGDVTASGVGSVAATVVNLTSGVTMPGTILASAIADPATPFTNKGYIYMDSTHHILNIKNDAGVVSNTVIPSAAVSNQFLTALAADGTLSRAQPAFTNISGTVSNGQLANSTITIAGTSTALGGSIAQDTITGLSSTGLIKRTGANVLAIAVAGTDYQSAITFGTGVQTALGINVGTAGSIVVNGGALGTPSGGTVTNLSGTASININGTVGATTPSTGAFTTLSATGQITSTLAIGTAPLAITSTTVVPNLNVSQLLGGTWASPGTIGSTTPNTGAFTTLSASSTVSGTGFSTYLASPPAIGGTAPAAGSFTTLNATGLISTTGQIGTSAGFYAQGGFGIGIDNSGAVAMTILHENYATNPWNLSFGNLNTGNRKVVFAVDMTFDQSLATSAAAQFDTVTANSGFTSTVGDTITGTLNSDPSIWTSQDTLTNASVYPLKIYHKKYSGTPTTNMGSGIWWQCDSSTTAQQDLAKERFYWSTATHATRKSKYAMQLVNNGGALADVFTIDGAGLATITGTGLVTSSLTLSGNISSTAWTTTGLRIKEIAATLTDTSSSGTVAAAYTDVLGGNTIAASAATTFTNYVTTFFNEPVAGTNVTFTNKWALGAASLRVGTSNQFTVSSAGLLTAPGGITNTPIGATPSTGSFTTLSATGTITSTLATGTAPLTVASTTQVANLNVSQLVGATWIAPGTIGSTTPSTGAFTTLSATGAITPAQVAGIVGTTTNNNAQAGSVGEYVESVLAPSSHITLVSGTPTNVTSISLTAGDWDVWGIVIADSDATTTATAVTPWISTTSATLVSINTCLRSAWQQTNALFPNAGYLTVEPPKQRISISATTTVYLSVQVNFGVANMYVSGAIRARRAR